jgi:hypothetical protein
MADQLGADAPAREATRSATELDGAEPDTATGDNGSSTSGAEADTASSTDAASSSDTEASTDAASSTDTEPSSDADELATDLFAPRPGDAAAVVTDGPADTDEAEAPTSGSTAPSADTATSTSAGVLERLGVRPRGRLRARKVQRIVRRVDPWSVLKVSLIFYFCVWLMVMVAAVLIWGAAVGSGTVSSLESFIAEFLAFEEFSFNGDQLFQIFALGGLIGVFVTTAATAVLAVLFNLIADLTGGIRFTVIEEESARRLINPR